MESIKDILYKRSKERSRNRAIEDGAYDGRFNTRIVINKKKNIYKTFRKNKHKIEI